MVVRTHSAGVHVGIEGLRAGEEITLHEARRVWYWQGANSLHEMSLHGVAAGSKISEPVAVVTLRGWTEILPCTEEAEQSLRTAGWPK